MIKCTRLLGNTKLATMNDVDTVLHMYDELLDLMSTVPVTLRAGIEYDDKANQFEYYTTMGKIFKLLGLFNVNINANTADEFNYPMSADNRFNHNRVEYFYNHFVNPPIRQTENVKLSHINVPNSEETFNMIGEIMNNFVACKRSAVTEIQVDHDELDHEVWYNFITPNWDMMEDEPEFAKQISAHFKNFRNLALNDFNYTIDKLFTMINTT